MTDYEEQLEELNNLKKKNIAVNRAHICDAVDSYLLNTDCFDVDQSIALPRSDYLTEFNADWANNPALVITKYMVFILLTNWGELMLSIFQNPNLPVMVNSEYIEEIRIEPKAALLEGTFITADVEQCVFRLTSTNSGGEHITDIANMQCNLAVFDAHSQKFEFENIPFKDLTMSKFKQLLDNVI